MSTSGREESRPLASDEGLRREVSFIGLLWMMAKLASSTPVNPGHNGSSQVKPISRLTSTFLEAAPGFEPGYGALQAPA